jgi:hypothetical protein
MRTGMALLGVALLLGCGPARQEADMGAGAPSELGAALNVRVEGDSVRLELHITNATGGPLTLEFGTAQRYDFEILGSGGEAVWRWSDDMMFAQVLGEEVLAAGETRRYGAVWPAPGAAGSYVARALLLSLNYPVELRTEFRAGD